MYFAPVAAIGKEARWLGIRKAECSAPEPNADALWKVKSTSLARCTGGRRSSFPGPL
jgi:hypothetical protein